MPATFNKVLIIGNGPSVRVADLDACRNYPSIAANRFHLSYKDHALRPIATFCIDPQMIKDHIREIALNSVSTLYIPRQFFLETLMRTGPRLGGIRFFPFDRGSKPVRFSKDFAKYSGNGASVIYSGIQFAVASGAKEIFLYGVDHNFQHGPIDESGRVKNNGETNHFITDYRGQAKKWFPPDLQRIEQAFQMAKDVCDKTGIKIWNASRGGNLKVFDRIDFEAARARLKEHKHV